MPRVARGDTELSFAEATAVLAEAAAGVGKMTVHEGLPHPFEGKAFVEREIRAKPRLLLDENWFYLPPQEVSPEDLASLQRLFRAGLFKPWGGLKFCGGFHADYAVGFESAGRAYRVLICFGCHEARLMRMPPAGSNPAGSPSFRVTTDLTDSGYKELQVLLKKFRNQRPPAPDPRARPAGNAPPKVPVSF